MEERELSQEEIDNATSSSKYLTTAPGYKSKFDPSEILVEGIIPKYDSAGDKLVCALEMGKFIDGNGLDLNSYADNLANFLSSIDIPHRAIFAQQINHTTLFLLTFSNRISDLLKDVYNPEQEEVQNYP